MSDAGQAVQCMAHTCAGLAQVPVHDLKQGQRLLLGARRKVGTLELLAGCSQRGMRRCWSFTVLVPALRQGS